MPRSARTLSFAVMRLLDRALGPPFVRLAARRAPAGECLTEEPERILVVKLLGLGALVLAEPALRALRERYPRARVTLATFRHHVELVPLLGSVDDAIGIDGASLPRFAAGTARALAGLRANPPDLALDLETSHFSALFTLLARARCRVGFQVAGQGAHRAYTRPVAYDEDRHATERFLALARAAGAPPPADTIPHLQLPARPTGSKSAPLVAVNVGTGDLCPERRWPPGRFVALIRRMLEETDAAVTLIGASADVRETAEVEAQVGAGPRLRNLAGKLSLTELVAFLGACDALVSCDGGPVHLAAAVGTPTVSLFGPESPARYGPRGPGHRALYCPTPCSPCLTVRNAKQAPCRGANRCMEQIPVEAAFDAVAGTLADRLAPSG